MGTESFIPAPPPGYEQLWLGDDNTIVAAADRRPHLYLDERAMQWRALDSRNLRDDNA